MLRLACALLFLVACGGSSRSFSGSVYADEEARYRIGELPPGWDALDVEAQNDLAWTQDDAILQVNSSCDPALDIPLAALTNHLLIGFTERAIESQELVPLDGREAMRTHVVAKLDGVPRELLFVVLKKDSCVYDFALVAPPGASFESAVSDYDALIAGFTTEAG